MTSIGLRGSQPRSYGGFQSVIEKARAALRQNAQEHLRDANHVAAVGAKLAAHEKLERAQRALITEEMRQKVLEDLRDENRDDIIAELRENLTPTVVQSLRKQYHPEVIRDLRSENKPDILAQLREEFREKVIQDLRRKLQDAVVQNLFEELRQEVQEQIEDELERNYVPQRKQELSALIDEQIRPMIEANIREEVTRALQAEAREEIRAQFFATYRADIEREARTEIDPNLSAFGNNDAEMGYMLPNDGLSLHPPMSEGDYGATYTYPDQPFDPSLMLDSDLPSNGMLLDSTAVGNFFGPPTERSRKRSHDQIEEPLPSQPGGPQALIKKLKSTHDESDDEMPRDDENVNDTNGAAHQYDGARQSSPAKVELKQKPAMVEEDSNKNGGLPPFGTMAQYDPEPVQSSIPQVSVDVPAPATPRAKSRSVEAKHQTPSRITFKEDTVSPKSGTHSAQSVGSSSSKKEKYKPFKPRRPRTRSMGPANDAVSSSSEEEEEDEDQDDDEEQEAAENRHEESIIDQENPGTAQEEMIVVETTTNPADESLISQTIAETIEDQPAASLVHIEENNDSQSQPIVAAPSEAAEQVASTTVEVSIPVGEAPEESSRIENAVDDLQEMAERAADAIAEPSTSLDVNEKVPASSLLGVMASSEMVTIVAEAREPVQDNVHGHSVAEIVSMNKDEDATGAEAEPVAEKPANGFAEQEVVDGIDEMDEDSSNRESLPEDELAEDAIETRQEMNSEHESELPDYEEDAVGEEEDPSSMTYEDEDEDEDEDLGPDGTSRYLSRMHREAELQAQAKANVQGMFGGYRHEDSESGDEDEEPEESDESEEEFEHSPDRFAPINRSLPPGPRDLDRDGEFEDEVDDGYDSVDPYSEDEDPEGYSGEEDEVMEGQYLQERRHSSVYQSQGHTQDAAITLDSDDE